MQNILTIGPYNALFIQGETNELAISFASIGHDPTRAPSPEFIATAIGRGCTGPARSALFIQDGSRSWANDPNFEAILQGALSLLPPFDKKVALGMSMGGFCALIAAQCIKLDAILAFVPQWSIDPLIMPDENRWSHWRERLPQMRWPQAILPPAPCQTYLFHAMGDDYDHARRYPMAPNCDHLTFDGIGHSDLVPGLKAKGALAGLLQAAFQEDRRRLLRIASSCGAKRLKGWS